MLVRDLMNAMDAIAPRRFASDWDNVGLLVGDPDAPLVRVLLAVDAAPAAVIEEAQRRRASAIVAYHPLIFRPEKRVVAGGPAFAYARAGIAVYCPHTALDVAEGGTNDVLADAVGLEAREPLRPGPPSPEVKLITFVPEENIETVSAALFAAGAGRIGNYRSCSFRSPGTGTFYGESGAHPAVGGSGKLERVPEIRLETIVPEHAIAAVVRALRACHPYEEPAFHLVPLASSAVKVGLGRLGSLTRVRPSVLSERLKAALGTQHLLVAGSDRPVERPAICAGSGGDLLEDAIRRGADLFVTGELRHHEVLRALSADLSVICTLHSVSERAALVPLAGRLAERLDGVDVALSEEDREPLRVV